MQTKILNYRIILTPDMQTGAGKPVYTAFCPTLGIADDGKTIEEALLNIKKAIEIYIESLIEDNLSVPLDHPETDIMTTTQINAPSNLVCF